MISRRPRWAHAAVPALLLAVGACGGVPSGPVPAGGTAPPAWTGSPTTAPATAPPHPATPVDPPAPAPPPTAAPGAGTPVTVAVAGDVHFAGASAAALEEGGLDAVAGVLGGADVALVNLETAITGRGTPADKEFVFRAPPRALTALREAGVDVVGMANNHGLDFGARGLADSLEAAAGTGMPVVGLGRDATEAYRPWTTHVRGHRVAVLAATQVLDSALATAWTATDARAGMASARGAEGRRRLTAAVRAASASADTVVVLLHWGRERDVRPLPDQRTLARDLVAAGADAVVGSHAHVLLGGGWLRSGGRTGYVDYGLGNFVFYASKGPATSTGVLLLTLAPGGGVGSAEWVPARIRSGVPVPLTGAAAESALAEKESLRAFTGLDAAPEGTRPRQPQDEVALGGRTAGRTSQDG